MASRDNVAAAIALLRAAVTDDAEGVLALMTTVPHRELVIGLLALLMSEVDRSDDSEEYIAAVQAAFIAQRVE